MGVKLRPDSHKALITDIFRLSVQFWTNRVVTSKTEFSMRKMLLSSLAVLALAIVATPGQLRAAHLTTLVRFNGTNAYNPGARVADASGNLFGTTAVGGSPAGCFLFYN
jgi:hypothetical protein